MVATSDCVKTKTVTGKKVSKPLMEKKRRARINKCLDQLKSLLENHHHTNNIRKRKLEKADILELTVRHLKHLQKIQSGSSVNAEVSDYQAGFRSCLSAVNQYLLTADKSKGSSRLCMVTHLSSNLLCAGGQTRRSSTMDSGAGEHRAEETKPQRLPQTVEASKAKSTVPLARCIRSLNPHMSTAHVFHSRPTEITGEQRLSLAASQVFATAHTQTAQEEKSSLHKNKDHCMVLCRNEVVATGSQDVWRPW